MSGFLPHLIRTLTERVDGIQAILLYGSQQHPQVADMWSDYDVCIVLNSSARIDEARCILAVNDIGTVVGREVYRRSHSVLYRTAMEFQSSMCLLDVTVSEFHEWNSTENRDQQTILFGHVELSSTPNTPLIHAAFRPDEPAIDPTWFKYIGAPPGPCGREARFVRWPVTAGCIGTFSYCGWGKVWRPWDPKSPRSLSRSPPFYGSMPPRGRPAS